jgi:cobalamin biosynthesis protein CobT
MITSNNTNNNNNTNTNTNNNNNNNNNNININNNNNNNTNNNNNNNNNTNNNNKNNNSSTGSIFNEALSQTESESETEIQSEHQTESDSNAFQFSNASPTQVQTNGHDCEICLAEMTVGEKFFTLKCRHTFHLDCIYRSLQSRFIEKVCPLCTFPISPKTRKEVTALYVIFNGVITITELGPKSEGNLKFRIFL